MWNLWISMDILSILIMYLSTGLFHSTDSCLIESAPLYCEWTRLWQSMACQGGASKATDLTSTSR